MKAEKNLKGTWKQAISSVAFPVLLVLGFRWLFFEPFVIPSGSMIPTLLVHDHILVNKTKVGIRLPFTNRFILQWNQLDRGDVVVFKFPENPDVYYVKRLVGLPGDRISLKQGVLQVNDKPWTLQPMQSQNKKDAIDDLAQTFLEDRHLVRYQNVESADFPEVQVAADEYFFLGDNRDQSNDSRFWGTVKSNLLVGRADWIWLSCQDTFQSADFICKPETIRWDRLFQRVQ